MIVSAAKTALMAYGFDATDPLNAWLDQGKNEIEESYDWPFLQLITTVANLALINSITIADATFFKVQSIRDVTYKNKLEYVEIDGFEEAVEDPTQNGPAQIYTVTSGNTIQIWPVPVAPVTYRIVYQNSLADINALSDPTTLPGPARFHYLYVIGAAYIGLQADNEEERSTNAQSMFEKGVSRLIRKYGSVLGSGRQVQNAQGY